MLTIRCLMTDSIAYIMGDISRMMRKRFDLAARSTGVTGPQSRVIFLLNRAPGLNQGQIADRLDVEPITTCRMIDRLEQAGLVERRRDPSDRRAWQIFNTRAATPLIDRLRSIADEILDHALSGLSAAEVDMLGALLHRIRNNMLAWPSQEKSLEADLDTHHG